MKRRKGEKDAAVSKNDRPDDAEEDKKQAGPKAKPGLFSPGSVLVPIFILLALGALSLYAYKYTEDHPEFFVRAPSEHNGTYKFTAEELRYYNGEQNKRAPLYVSIRGNVFDVSRGWKHYAPGRPYHYFTGRDASRAFVTGCTEGECLTENLDGLSAEELKAIDDWVEFYHKTYKKVGILVSRN
eukprot:tig00021464_g21735.t1